MKIARTALLATALMLGARPAGAQMSAYPITTITSVTPATVAQAKAAYGQIVAGTLDRSTLTPALAGSLSDAVAAALRRKVASLGAYDAFAPTAQTDTDGTTTTIFRLHFPAGYLDYEFGVDDATGKIAKLVFVPGPPEDPAK